MPKLSEKLLSNWPRSLSAIVALIQRVRRSSISSEATLKGKKLGQYFTPRPLIELMHALVGREKVVSTLGYVGQMRVVDPACGTGGFLVYLMLAGVEQANDLLAKGKINASRRDELVQKIRQQVFFWW